MKQIYKIRTEAQKKTNGRFTLKGEEVQEYAAMCKKDGLMRRPRSKKRMNLLKSVDFPSLTDEKIIEKMRREQGNSVDAESITSEDICSYLNKIEEEFIQNVQIEMKIEEEELERMVRERDESRIKACLAKCYIEGCEVHSIINEKSGWEDVEHYRKDQIPEKYMSAYDLYRRTPRCTCVEIYQKCMAAIADTGEVIKIEKITQN